MNAQIEHVSSLLRVWDDDQQYGDPYCWAVAIRWINKSEVELLLQQQHITPAIWRAVVQLCQSQGIERVLAVTYPGGSAAPPRHKWIDVTKPLKSETKGMNDETTSRI